MADTGFIGYLINETDPIFTLIKELHQVLKAILKDRFDPQIYPHTTLVYLGDKYDTCQKIEEDAFFTDRITKLRNCICKFERLDMIGRSLVLVYNFFDSTLGSVVSDLTKKYEHHRPAKNLHITIGSLSPIAYHWFNEERRRFFEEKLGNFAFIMSSPQVIRVSAQDKSYHLVKAF